jgi:uncharacterized protein
MKVLAQKIFVAILALLLAGVTCAAAQSNASSAATQPAAKQASQDRIDPAKEADIRRLLDLVGTKALITNMMESMIGNIKPMMANSLPTGEYRAKLVDLFFEKFRAKADVQHLLNLAVSGYDKKFTHEEIKGLIKFYETPLGQKVISVQPQLVADMSAAGRAWGEKLGRECMQEVLAEHPEIADALEAAGKAAQQR